MSATPKRPWRVERYEQQLGKRKPLRLPDGYRIRAADGEIVVDGLVNEEVARLMASAPGLLQALIDRGIHDKTCPAYREIGRFGSASGLTWNETTDPETCRCPLGAAIADARRGR